MTVIILPHETLIQPNSFWCGPTSAHNAMSTRGVYIPLNTLAGELGTTEDGTGDVDNIVGSLRRYTGAPYITNHIPNDPPTAEQVDLFWTNVSATVQAGYGGVINIWAPANNHPPAYPNYMIQHYIMYCGINTDTREVYCGDSAGFGVPEYWLPAEQLCSMISPKGYTSCPDADDFLNLLSPYDQQMVAAGFRQLGPAQW